MDQFTKVQAVFNPKKVDDLQAGVAEFAGRSGVFMAAHIIEQGEYEGQMAMQSPVGWPFAWCPESDLEI